MFLLGFLLFQISSHNPTTEEGQSQAKDTKEQERGTTDSTAKDETACPDT